MSELPWQSQQIPRTGAAGETSTLSPAEHESVTRTAVEIAGGRARVIAGAGSNSTSHAIELTKRAETAGADAILSAVPSFSTVSLNHSTRAGRLSGSAI